MEQKARGNEKRNETTLFHVVTLNQTTPARKHGN
jgi:hypothetical protein